MAATTATAPPDATDGRLGGSYRRLWAAAVISRLGDALRNPALALLAAAVTRDPRAVAAVFVAGQLPPLLFGLLGGVYADRWDRRRTMAAVDGLRALLVGAFAVLVATGQTSISTLAACAFALATLGTLFDASAFAMLPAIVPADRLPTANGRLQAGTAVAGGFVGAPAAGVLFALAAALPFAVDAVSFAAAALLALTLRPAAPDPAGSAPVRSAPDRTGKPRHPATGQAVARRSAWREAGDGLRWIRHEPTLRLITVLTAVSNLAISGLVAIIVLFALDVLRVSESGYGLFMSAAVVGGLLGGLGAGRLASRFGTLPSLRWVLAAETLALAALAVSRHPVPGALALAVFSAGSAAWNSLWSAYGQRHVPAGMLGRVGSAQRMAGLLTAPAGAVLAGLVAEAYGLPVVVYAAAIMALVTVGAWRALRPRVAAPATAGRRDRQEPRPVRCPAWCRCGAPGLPPYVNRCWHTLVGVTSSDQPAARRRSDATRSAILRAAREHFAADGYERATIRAIAADAAIDPSMVMRYYGSKERLFAAAAEFDLRLPDLSEVPPDQVGAVLVGHFVDRWDGDETMTALLRAGVTNPAAAERMREIFARQLTTVVSTLVTGTPTGGRALPPESRAGLVASQILGLALTRYVLCFPPVAALDRAALITWIGPTIQRYLVGQP